MRTPEQIKNLRIVLTGMIGPYAIIASDEEVNTFGDLIQHKINNITHIWDIRVRLKCDLSRDWTDIDPEPKSPDVPFETMFRKIGELLKKYPLIDSILITDTLNAMDKSYLIKRKGE
jgi:hypothetical protein